MKLRGFSQFCTQELLLWHYSGLCRMLGLNPGMLRARQTPYSLYYLLGSELKSAAYKASTLPHNLLPYPTHIGFIGIQIHIYTHTDTDMGSLLLLLGFKSRQAATQVPNNVLFFQLTQLFCLFLGHLSAQPLFLFGAQESLLVGLGIKPGFAMCKANTLPGILSLCPGGLFLYFGAIPNYQSAQDF